MCHYHFNCSYSLTEGVGLVYLTRVAYRTDITNSPSLCHYHFNCSYSLTGGVGLVYLTRVGIWYDSQEENMHQIRGASLIYWYAHW